MTPRQSLSAVNTTKRQKRLSKRILRSRGSCLKKKSMLAQNERVNWVPAHLKHGRFKHIVENAPDWTISRNRFWASALPIWKEKGGSRLMVIGSLKELLEKTKKSGNTYFVMRHAEAGHNVEGVDDLTGDPANHVTEKGKTDAVHAAALGLMRGSI